MPTDWYAVSMIHFTGSMPIKYIFRSHGLIPELKTWAGQAVPPASDNY